MADSTTWIAAVGPIAGYIAGLATEVIRGRSESASARAQREAVRQAELQDRRNAFEQETLASLSDAVGDFLHAVEVMNRMQQVTYRTTGRWTLTGDDQKAHLEGELWTRYRAVTRHIDLVMDEDLRSKITGFAEAVWEMYAGEQDGEQSSSAATGRLDPKEARDNAGQAYHHVLELYVKLQREIGRQRRELFLRGFERVSLEI